MSNTTTNAIQVSQSIVNCIVHKAMKLLELIVAAYSVLTTNNNLINMEYIIIL